MRRSAQPSLWRVAQIVVGSLLAVAVLIVGIGALLPRDWYVQETILINAPPAAVHAWAADLERWPRWAQWNQSELWPRNQVSKPSTGPGATLHWYGRARGGGETAAGEVRIVRSEPTSGVWFENRTPSSELSQASLRYEQRPGVTLVTWEDRGRLPPIIGGLFLDLFQKRLHSHMAGGLERLKDLVEGDPVDSSPVEESTVEESTVEESPVKGSPVDGSPVNSSPVNSSPVDPAPADRGPASGQVPPAPPG